MHDIEAILFAVVRDCRRYLEEYYYKGVIVGAVLAFLYCIIFLGRFICACDITRSNFLKACGKIPFIALLGFYSYLVLGITVLSRSKGATYILKPVPFSTWRRDFGTMTLWIENIVMMIPMGILLYILWKPFRGLRWSMLAGFLCSLLIECVQLFTRLGKFETDDIMNNVFGVMIGFVICKIIGWIFDRDNTGSRHS